MTYVQTIPAILLFLCGTACRQNLPTGPSSLPPTAPKRYAIFGTVVGSKGECLIGATVEVLDSSQPQRVQQRDPECTTYNLDEAGPVFVIQGLPIGTSVQLRASMDGYESQTFPGTVIECCQWPSSIIVKLKPLDPAGNP
jgi:hypothetical protein